MNINNLYLHQVTTNLRNWLLRTLLFQFIVEDNCVRKNKRTLKSKISSNSATKIKSAKTEDKRSRTVASALSPVKKAKVLASNKRRATTAKKRATRQGLPVGNKQLGNKITVTMVQRGLQDAAAGRVSKKGSFAKYIDDNE